MVDRIEELRKEINQLAITPSPPDGNSMNLITKRRSDYLRHRDTIGDPGDKTDLGQRIDKGFIARDSLARAPSKEEVEKAASASPYPYERELSQPIPSMGWSMVDTVAPAKEAKDRTRFTERNVQPNEAGFFSKLKKSFNLFQSQETKAQEIVRADPPTVPSKRESYVDQVIDHAHAFGDWISSLLFGKGKSKEAIEQIIHNPELIEKLGDDLHLYMSPEEIAKTKRFILEMNRLIAHLDEELDLDNDLEKLFYLVSKMEHARIVDDRATSRHELSNTYKKRLEDRKRETALAKEHVERMKNLKTYDEFASYITHGVSFAATCMLLQASAQISGFTIVTIAFHAMLMGSRIKGDFLEKNLSHIATELAASLRGMSDKEKSDCEKEFTHYLKVFFAISGMMMTAGVGISAWQEAARGGIKLTGWDTLFGTAGQICSTSSTYVTSRERYNADLTEGKIKSFEEKAKNHQEEIQSLMKKLSNKKDCDLYRTLSAMSKAQEDMIKAFAEGIK